MMKCERGDACLEMDLVCMVSLLVEARTTFHRASGWYQAELMLDWKE